MRISILFYCLSLAGCAFNTEYPASWPEPAAASDSGKCPDISGTFSDLGEFASGDGNISLSALLAQLDVSNQSTTISLEGEYTVVVEHAGKAFEGSDRIILNRSSGDFSCDGGRLWISRIEWADPDGGIAVIIGRSKDNFGFTKTADGSLLAELNSSAGGALLLGGVVPIPVTGKDRDYVLWRSVGPASNTGAPAVSPGE